MSNPSPDYAALPARELDAGEIDYSGRTNRALDALIARLLFGWTKVYAGVTGTYGSPPDASSRRTIPHYSTDPAAMMDLWQALLKRPGIYEVAIEGYSEDADPDPERFAAEVFMERRASVREFTSTPMRALCLAALAALAALAPASPAAGKERAK